ncbi:MAG: 1-deoxy-D-xylulose-5-phosphate reductoisomerase [candidate division WOR-3 bacterium]|nr:1-deoxy-D-xylulose-5-phosphate reductoisomerase [candidate division WOR-3 bacterium]
MKKVAIFGSTGSIGRNALSVIKRLKGFEVFALYVGNNISLLIKQSEEFNPEFVGTFFKENKKILEEQIKGRWKTLIGMEGAVWLAERPEVDTILIGAAGSSVYELLIRGLKNGKRVATANKESLVAYSSILRKKIPDLPGELIPIDSEHSAIYQSLSGSKRSDVRKVILTASGGPFYERESFDGITPEEALNHPTWQMGKKVTIDSATLMNKGFEIIEASVLFDLSWEEIEVVIHPQSIIHGMVEFKDGSVISQMSIPDMKIPIQFALTAPRRKNHPASMLVSHNLESLTFKKVDEKRFPLIPLSYYALRVGGTLPAVLVASDEVAVEAFLKGKIEFKEIMDIVIKVAQGHKVIKEPDISDIVASEKWASQKAKEMIK